MSTSTESCLICGMESSDHESVIFRDDLWAAEIGRGMEVPGWFVLRTRRHAELITGLHDAEVDGLGRRLRALVAAVAAATGAPATYQVPSSWRTIATTMRSSPRAARTCPPIAVAATSSNFLRPRPPGSRGASGDRSGGARRLSPHR